MRVRFTRRTCQMIAVLTTTAATSACGELVSGAPEDSTPASRVLAAPRANVADYEFQTWIADGPLQRAPDTSTFDTTDGTITCHWIESPPPKDRVVCQLRNRVRPAPPAPPDCDTTSLSWATVYVSVDATGPTDGLCTGGIQVPFRGSVLPEGTALVAGYFGCLPEAAGVTCVHLPTGRGFTVSATDLRMF